MLGRVRRHEVDEDPVDAGVASHLGMERRRHQRALPDRDDPTGGRSRAGSATFASTSTPSPTASTHGARMKIACTGSLEPGEVEVGLEGVDLASEGVAAHGDVEAAERLLPVDAVLDPVGQQDHAGAGAEDRHPVRDPLAQRVEQVEDPGQLGHRRRLTARQDQAVALRELGLPPYGDRARAQGVQDAQMLTHVALQGEDTDDGSGHGRRLVPPPRRLETAARWGDEKPSRGSRGRTRHPSSRAGRGRLSRTRQRPVGGGGVPSHAAVVPGDRAGHDQQGRAHAAVRPQRHAVRSGDGRRVLRPGDQGRDQGAHRQLRGRHREPVPGAHLVLDDPVLPVAPPPRARARRLRASASRPCSAPCAPTARRSSSTATSGRRPAPRCEVFQTKCDIKVTGRVNDQTSFFISQGGCNDDNASRSGTERS